MAKTYMKQITLKRLEDVRVTLYLTKDCIKAVNTMTQWDYCTDPALATKVEEVHRLAEDIYHIVFQEKPNENQ